AATGSGAAGGAALGGAITLNDVATSATAHVVNTLAPAMGVLAAGDVKIEATDNATITSTAVVASLSVSVGDAAFALSLGAAVAQNTIGSSVSAAVDNSTVASTGGAVDVKAFEKSHITATPVAASISVAVGFTVGSVSLAGAGTAALNTTTATVDAHVVNSAVSAATEVTV